MINLTGSIDINNVRETFNSQVLSTIGKGIIITKDYFLDLFGRVATFYSIKEITRAIFCGIVFIILSLYISKLVRRIKKLDEGEGGPIRMLLILYLAIIIGLLAGMFGHIIDSLKRKYIPEVQAYHLIQDLRYQPTTETQ